MIQINRLRNISVYLLILCICLMMSIPSAAGKLTAVTERGGIYTTLHSDAHRWLQAVLSRDRKTLISFALPEYRLGIDKNLNDESSTLCRVLFNGPESVRGKYRTIQEVGIVFLKEVDLQRFGNGTWVCFYDKSSGVPQWPDSAGLPPDDTFCVFFFRADNRWYVSYDF